MLKTIRKIVLDIALAVCAALAVPTRAGTGPERAGGVFPFGETPHVRCAPSAEWTLADWRGRTWLLDARRGRRDVHRRRRSRSGDARG